jgi:hypothetical protein
MYYLSVNKTDTKVQEACMTLLSQSATQHVRIVPNLHVASHPNLAEINIDHLCSHGADLDESEAHL